MDPVAEVPTLQIEPYACSNPPFSTRAPHGKIKRITPTLKRPKAFKRLKIPLKIRRTTTTFTPPPVNTINPLFVQHIKIARKIGVTRYKLARIRPVRQVIDPILPVQGTILNMIWSWALSTFAPESLEQKLQFNTQYLTYEPPSACCSGWQ